MRRIIRLYFFLTATSSQAALVLTDEDNMVRMRIISSTITSDEGEEAKEIYANAFGAIDEGIFGEQQVPLQISMSMAYGYPEESTYSGKKGKGEGHQTEGYASLRTGKKGSKKGEKYIFPGARNWDR